MNKVRYMVSPKYDLDNFRSGGDEVKIDVYEDRVKGWIIKQAEFVAKNNGSGFAELLIILSFFESHAIYLPDSPTDSGGNKFKHVVKKVFPGIEGLDIAEKVLRYLWKDGRNGLYHGGITGDKITISGSSKAITVLKIGDDYKIDIDPGKFVNSVRIYFESYITDLKDTQNTALREHFFEKLC